MLARKEQGTVMTEFMLVLPAFLFIIFLVMELSLFWIDRHFLRLAAFESARILTMSSQTNPCSDEQLVKAAEQRATWRMAAVTEAFVKLPDTEKGQDAQAQSSSILRVFGHLVTRWPSSMLMTHLSCENDPQDPRAVAVVVTYHHRFKMPLVREFFSFIEQFALARSKIKVRLVKPGYTNEGKDWVDGMAFGIAPFNFDAVAENWNAWAKAMGDKPVVENHEGGSDPP